MAAEQSRSRQQVATIGEDVIGDVLSICIGDIGCWQICLFLLLILAIFPLSFQELVILFLNPHEDFYCVDETLDKCSDSCPEHIFDKSQFESTISSEWDLVCGREWIGSIAQTVLMGGILTGHVIVGILADIYGRRKPLIGSVIMVTVVGTGVALVPDLWQFMVLRFLVAVAAGGIEISCFVMIVEIAGSRFRPYLVYLCMIPFFMGFPVLAFIAYFIKEWHTLQLVISVPAIGLICYYWLLPESPRWLLLTGRRDEAINTLEKAQKFNNKPYSHIKDAVNSMIIQKKTDENYFDLFKTKYVRMTTLIIYLEWAIIGFVYFGVSQMTGKLYGNIYVNVFVSGICQITSAIALLATVNRIGRKTTAMIPCGIGAVSLLLLAVVPQESMLIVVLCCTGLMAISATFTVQYLWAGELFPTVVRNIGIGSAAVCAKVGSMIAPLIADLYKSKPWLTPIIFGSVSVVAFLSYYILPETLNAAMMDTIEEAEVFGKRIRNKS